MTGCPAPEDLDALLGGGLSGELADAVEAHVDECSACRIALGELADDAPPPDLAATVPERPSAPAPKRAGQPAQIDRYRIEKKLGAGGMGIVLLAEDPELQRKVVIKLLHPELTGDDTRGRQRLLREAQAMAKVSHPNVVPIYDVGVHDDQVFIAMEFLDGGDLAKWLEKPRTLREIVDVFLAAGRGLAAAHRAGLVHRDFKPHNVILGSHGEVKVSDFGLARPERTSGEREVKAPLKPTLLDTPLTREGVAVGTPAYMAPEQIMAEDVDHRADQFSFCIALFQAVYGELPFRGKDTAEVLQQTLDANVPSPPTDRSIPRSLRRVLERGLAAKPVARFASMDALLAELQPRRRWVVPAIAAGALVVAGIAGGAFMLRDKSQLCTGDAAEVAPVWNAEQRGRIESAFAALPDPAARDAGVQITHEIDQYVATWRTDHREACRATRVHGSQSEAVMAERMRCLSQRRFELAAFIDVMSHPDASMIAAGPGAAARLTSPRSCDFVGERTLLPEEIAAENAISPDLARATALVAAQKLDDGIALLKRTLARPATQSSKRLLALVSYQLGTTEVVAQQWEDAYEHLQSAAQLADGTRDDAMRAHAFVYMIDAALGQGHKADAKQALGFARSAMERAGDDGSLAALVELRAAEVARANDDDRSAEASYQSAIQRYTALRGAQSPEVAIAHRSYATYLNAKGRYDDAYAQIEQAHAIQIQTVGIHSLDVAVSLFMMANIRFYQQRFDDAVTLARANLAIMSKFFAADDPRLAPSYTTLALALAGAGKTDEAAAMIDKGQVSVPASMGTDTDTYVGILFQLGTLYAQTNHLERAYKIFADALQVIDDRYHTRENDFAIVALDAMGSLQRQQGKLDDAVATLTEARTLVTKLHPHSAYMAETLTRLGVAERYRKNYAVSAQLLEDAYAMGNDVKAGGMLVGWTAFELAQSLWASGGDKARALQLARDGRDTLAKAGDRKTTAEATAWLAAHETK